MICRHCESEIPDDSIACRECGSDHETGWADPIHGDGLMDPEPVTTRTRRAPGPIPIAAVAMLSLFLATVVLGVIETLVLGGAIAIVVVAWRLLARSPVLAERRARGELLRLTRGDDALAERLIRYERTRMPSLAREQAIRSAKERLERDRR